MKLKEEVVNKLGRMVIMRKTFLKNILGLTLALGLCAVIPTNSKAACYQQQEVDLQAYETFRSDNEMCVDKKGNVYNFHYSDAVLGLNGVVRKYVYAADKAVKKLEIPVNCTYDANVVMSNNRIIIADEYDDLSKKAVFSIHNLKGKKIKTITDKLNRRSGKYKSLDVSDSEVLDIDCIGKTLIYHVHVSGKNEGNYLRWLDIQSGKVVYQKKISSSGYDSKIQNHKLYSFVIENNSSEEYVTDSNAKKAVRVFSLKGKKLGEYKVPKTKHSLEDKIFAKGNKLYYLCEAGIYVRKQNKNSEWKLFYDASGDSYFENKAYRDLCIVDNNTFYVGFSDDKEVNLSNILVRYSKRH